MSRYYDYKCSNKYTNVYFVCVTDIHLFHKLILNATLMTKNIP